MSAGGDLKKLAARMQQLSETLKENADRMVRKTALTIGTTLVLATPVRHGRARANWLPSYGAPTEDTVEGPVLDASTEGSEASPDATRGAAEAAATTEAMDRLQSSVAGYDMTRDGSFWISNNLPYIGRLNEGHSARAPAKFVEAAVAAGEQAVRSSVLLKRGGVSGS